ncbi:MAG TPA: zinc ribbon domain-containing protein [Anaerolineales bacterium]|nr:zinc ribbon domain-containing protein [Anaerolineales bacterium]
MSRTLRTTLWVLGGIVVAALLFGLGMQLYWMTAGSAAGGFRPMMDFGWGMHAARGGFVFPFLGPILGLGLLALAVVGIVSLFNRPGDRPAANCTNCGSALTAGWAFCPRCGQKV